MEQIIEKFYLAFKELDAEAMVKHYHDDVIFSDPAFGTLKGERAKNMWRMLIASQKNKQFTINFQDVFYENELGKATWEAHYKFSKTNRPVHNTIHAEFKFKDGLIIEHKDVFNLYRWAKQALGFKGYLLGGTNFFKERLQKSTSNMLDKYEKKKS